MQTATVKACIYFSLLSFTFCLGVSRASAQIPAGAATIVVPFENPTQEARLTWMREGAAILLGETLAAAGEIVIDREERLAAFDRLQLPATANLSRASTIRVGQAISATFV